MDPAQNATDHLGENGDRENIKFKITWAYQETGDSALDSALAELNSGFDSGLAEFDSDRNWTGAGTWTQTQAGAGAGAGASQGCLKP